MKRVAASSSGQKEQQSGSLGCVNPKAEVKVHGRAQEVQGRCSFKE
jgi:hypothetical protein